MSPSSELSSVHVLYIKCCLKIYPLYNINTNRNCCLLDICTHIATKVPSHLVLQAIEVVV